MGVDVEMFAAINADRTEDEIFKAAVQMHERFGLWVNREKRVHGITAVSEEPFYDLQGGVPEGMKLVEVHTLARYYGPGYARGDCLKIVGMAEFLEYTWPEAVVWYGSDSGDWLEKFPAEKRDELKRFFFENGGVPYYARGFGGGETHTCEWCAMPISVHTASGGWYMGTCDGCGGKFIYGPEIGWSEAEQYADFEKAKTQALIKVSAQSPQRSPLQEQAPTNENARVTKGN